MSLAYQELQALSLDQFKKTFFLNPANRGADLETLAIDHFGTGASRPEAQKAIGAVIVTRDTGNTGVINVPSGQVFTSNEKDFVATEAVTILASNDSGVVEVEAVEAGVGGNIRDAQTWKTSIPDVTVTNTEAFQGGRDVLNDQEYRTYIQNFVESVQDGTATGLEGTAKLVPGVSDAKVIKKLVDVGTLDNTGALKSTGLLRFKDVILQLYVASESEATNASVRALVESRVKGQLSAGNTVSVISASPQSIDWTVTLVFTASPQALALAKDKNRLQSAFEQAISDLGIGDDFDRDAMITKVLTDNNWTGLFTGTASAPAGDVTIAENQKAVPGTITIQVS